MKKTKWVVPIALLFAFPLMGCAETGERLVKEYTVTMTQTESRPALSYEEMLEEIRPTVVDVSSFMESGTSAGSGVIIAGAKESDSSGEYDEYFIVTNHHVIDGGLSFKVDVLSIGSEGEETTVVYDATLIGSSMKRDIAVLSIRPPEGTSLSIASFLDDSDHIKVGTEVYAIGNPLGILGGTVTHGIISATKRDVNVGEIGTMTLLQTDASINGGNSGGGLFDRSGNLVGIINSGYDSYNGTSVEGLNFAIPANDARFAAQELIKTHEEENGKVTKYGYVEGDARMDVTFSTATLYKTSLLLDRGTYLVAGAASVSSPFYVEWGTGLKAVLSISVNGEKTDFTESGSSSYTLTERANQVISSVQANDTVVIRYQSILSKSSGFGGLFGVSYYYLDEQIKEASVTARQYIYEPENV